MHFGIERPVRKQQLSQTEYTIGGKGLGDMLYEAAGKDEDTNGRS